MSFLKMLLGGIIGAPTVGLATTLYGIPPRGSLGILPLAALPLAAYGIPSPGLTAVKSSDIDDVSGNILCEFNNKLVGNRNLQLAILALIKYVANVDSEVSAEEKIYIDKFADKICYLNPDMQVQVNKILLGDLNFDELTKKYLLNIDKETFKLLDDYVMLMVNADNKVSDKEEQFLRSEWEILRRSFE